MSIEDRASERLNLEDLPESVLLRATIAHLHARLCAVEQSPILPKTSPTLQEVMEDVTNRLPDAIIEEE